MGSARKSTTEELLGDRVCWRIHEWRQLTGLSRPTIWRQIKAGTLKITYLGKIPMVPRSEGVRLGLIAN
jgi:predicted DNA-binding transcriptional regulator AlpA